MPLRRRCVLCTTDDSKRRALPTRAANVREGRRVVKSGRRALIGGDERGFAVKKKHVPQGASIGRTDAGSIC
ncbi:hypothetical protein PSAB6_740006 [Paraburkholderia sabiae]|nr:hypothetical protein PSAB6_740006 [Paraburkholderia sabiae]